LKRYINNELLDTDSLEYWLEYDKQEIAEAKREYYDNMKSEQNMLKIKIQRIEKRMEERKSSKQFQMKVGN